MEREQERRIDRNSWRIDALDKWRDQMEKRVSVLESEVLTEKQARILSEALSRQGKLRLTRAQSFAVIVAAGSGIADLVLRSVGLG